MNIKEVFKSQGFANIYDWHDEPGKIYEEHSHQGKVSLYIVDGSITFSGGINKTVLAKEIFDVPIGVVHSAIVGPNGCNYIVGEEIKGDS
jgi:quercetin dioxygenase-like cupin family protein